MNLLSFKSWPEQGRRWTMRLALAFIVYAFVGFSVVPALVKWQLVKRLPAITKRQATVQQVTFNPLALTLTVRGLALNEPDGRPFASWDEFYVNFQASSLFRWAWTFEEIRIVKPFGEVILLKDGRLNFANMLEARTNAPPPSAVPSIPRVLIARLEVTNGFVALEDRTRRTLFRTEYRPINLNLKAFTTRPDADTPYSFHAESDSGRSVTWAGDLTIQPLRSSGRLEIKGVKLSRYQPYLEEFTSAHVTNGLADLQFNYRFAAGTNGLDLIVTNASAQVAQVQVIDPATGETVSGLRGLDVREAGLNLRERAVRLGAVKVSEATLLTRLNKSGRLNLLDLITLPAPATNARPTVVAAPTPGPWTVTVDDFTIEQTAVSFEDLMRRTLFKTELKPIAVSLKHFTTKAGSDASYSFRIASEAAETFEGVGTVSINPIRSSGEVKVSAVDVKKYLPYAEDFFRGKILSGRIEARVPYQVALGTNSLLAGVTNLAVKLTDLEVQLPENAETVTRIEEIGFERVDANLEERRGRVGLFKGVGGSILARRQKDGAINLLGLLAVSRTNAGAATNPRSSSTPSGSGSTNTSAVALGGWILNLDEVRLENYTVKVEDLMPSKPATFLLDQLGLSLKGASTVSNTPVNANISFRLNETATINARGVAKITPLFADFEFAVTNLDLRAAQPYLDPFVALDLASGVFSTAGRIRFQTNDSAQPRLTFAGGVRLTNLVTTDQVGFKEFARWDDLTVNGIEAALMPNRFKIDEILLVRPKGSLLIGADRRPNLSMILKKDASATNTSVAITAPAPASTSTNSLADLFPVELGTLRLDRASLVFTDESMQPRVALGIEEMSGTIKGLSSALSSPAVVDLHGRVDAQSPFSITGRVNPLAATVFVDLTITNANTQLTPLTGYMEKYGGYPLVKGRVSTSLRYHVEGQALQAENKIQVDQLTLGARNNSPEATSLPVKLGVALLKDNNGRIELDVPVNGKLDDPQFKLGPIVLKIIGNMLVKAAASPFKLLGSLVGGGGEELSFVEFTAGTTNVVEGELDKLGKLTAALIKRPALNLEIEGAVDPAIDRQALAKLKLHQQIQAKRLQELTARGRAPGSVETFQVEPEEYDRLLRAAFIEQFGTNIAEVIQTNLTRLTATNQTAAAASPKPKRSLLQRVTGVFTGGSDSSAKAEKRLSKSDRQALGLATPELMEELLAEQIEITDEEFLQLISARARSVQDWCVQNGQVGADRLLLVAPKPVDANYRGACRVNLSVN